MSSNHQNLLPYKHISHGVKTTLEYIRKRQSGEEKSLKTRFKKLDKLLLDGIDWYRIFTIAGRSGSGKSVVLENLKHDFITLNEPDFDILSFEFEMRIEDTLTRIASSEVGMSVKEIYSAGSVVTDDQLKAVSKSLEKVSESPIYYVDNVGTVTEILDTIMAFVNTNKLKERDRGIIVTIDHVLLTKNKQGEAEKDVIDNLMKSLVALKKYYAGLGVRCLFITLSQLNRDIEQGDRVTNKNLHYPTRSDLFAASSVYYCSDYVLITHRPATITGLGQWYGPPKKNFPYGLPVAIGDAPAKHCVFWHLIKERFGETAIISMVENFKESKIEEITL